MATENMEKVEISESNSGNMLLEDHSKICSLLVIIGEPFNNEHKTEILERLEKDLMTWDVISSGCSVTDELKTVLSQNSNFTDTLTGAKVLEQKSESFYLDVLISADLETIRSHLAAFLLADFKYRSLVYAGNTLHGPNMWLVRDGIYPFSDFLELFRSGAITEAMKRQPAGSFIDIHMPQLGEWNESVINKFVPNVKVRVNPTTKHLESSCREFAELVSNCLPVRTTSDLLASSTIVGSICFNRPTLYIFPGGEGDCCLFGISGFNFLVNAGYSRKSCFWDFARHLNRIDALLSTHIGPDNIFGLSSFLEKKTLDTVHPELGHVFLNMNDSKKGPVLNGKDDTVHSNHCIIDLAKEGQKMAQNLHALGLASSPCMATGNNQPVNIYHKIGHGALDLYVLNPQDGKELKDFMVHWAKHLASPQYKNGIATNSYLSVSCVLVWKPSNSPERCTRVFFPSNTPQQKLFECLDRMKNVPVFQNLDVHKTAQVQKGSEKKPPQNAKPSKTPSARPTPVNSARESANRTFTADHSTTAPKAEHTTKASSEHPGKSEHGGRSAHQPSGAASKADHKEVKKTMGTQKKEPNKSTGGKQQQQHQKKPDSGAKKPSKTVDKPAVVHVTETPVVEPTSSTEEKPAVVSDPETPAMPVVNKSSTPEDKSASDVQSPVCPDMDQATTPVDKPALDAQSPAHSAMDQGSTLEEKPASDIAVASEAETPLVLVEEPVCSTESVQKEEHITEESGAISEQSVVTPTEEDVKDTTEAAVADVSQVHLEERERVDQRHPEQTDVPVETEQRPEQTDVPVETELKENQICEEQQPSEVQEGREHAASEISSEQVNISTAAQPDNPEVCPPSNEVPPQDNPAVAAEPAGDATQQDNNNQAEQDPKEGTQTSDASAAAGSYDPEKEWGQPMGLPAPMNGKVSERNVPNDRLNTTQRKPERKSMAHSPAKSKPDSEAKKGRLSMAPGDHRVKNETKSGSAAAAKKPAAKPLKPVTPFYVDLSYIPSHGDLRYFDVDFFRRVRSKYYVLSTVQPDPKVIELLMEAKGTWDDPAAKVIVIPTYDNETLKSWFYRNKNQLAEQNIDLLPAASRCTIQLQDQESGCAAYRLEF